MALWKLEAAPAVGQWTSKSWEERTRKNRISALDFRRSDFGLIRDLLWRILWVAVLERKEIKDNWLIFKDHLQVQEWSSPVYNRWQLDEQDATNIKTKNTRGGSRNLWPRKKIDTLSEHAGQGSRKSKSELERDVRGNKKGFYKYIVNKKKPRESVSPLNKTKTGH